MGEPSAQGPNVGLGDVQSAQRRIADQIIRTPQVLCGPASDRAGARVYLKLENLQRTGAFKVRGALNKVASLAPEERQRGLICASSGNHGLGVAYAAVHYHSRSVVVLPEDASPHKTSLLRELGAEIVPYGHGSDARQEKVEELSRKHGYLEVHPFADPAVIAGQGTIGLEILADLPEVDEVYVPIGGGGLISGIALAVKERRPETRIYGVEPEHASTMWTALRHDGPVLLPRVETIADGLAAAITSNLNFSMVRRYVDEIILVSEYDILEAMIFLLDRAKVLVEPSGAASVAGLFANPGRHGKAVAVVSGGNVDPQNIEEYRRRQKEGTLDLGVVPLQAATGRFTPPDPRTG